MFKKFAILLSSAALLVSAVTVTSSASAIAKTKKAHRVATAGRGAYLVPPPPPYQPSILPENLYSRASTVSAQPAAEKPPENPYKKYIYTRNPADTPTPVQQNKYVSYWSAK